MNKTIVIGSNGFIGKALVESLKPIIYTHYKEAPFLLNLKDPTLDHLPITDETYVIIAAGSANVNYCNEQRDETRAINVEGTLKLAKECVKKGLFPILFSTDYVFNGETGGYTESSIPSPINEYGKQKKELENRIHDATKGEHLILRLSKIYSTTKGDNSLLDEMFQNLSSGNSYRAATDQVFSPLHVKDLVQIISELISLGKKGLYNIGGKKELSRFDLAVNVSKAIGTSKEKVLPISLDDLGGSTRPKKTYLCCDKLYQTVSLVPETIETSTETLSSYYLDKIGTS